MRVAMSGPSRGEWIIMAAEWLEQKGRDWWVPAPMFDLTFP
jgi:hypothetical protein